MKIEYKVLCTENNEQRIKNVEIMKKSLPNLSVKMSGREHLFENFINTFNIENDSTGLVLLEDDIILCKNFQSRCENLISSRPNEVISMFEGPCSKKELHSEYRNGRIFMCNLCNYFPKFVCNELAKENNVLEFKEWYKKHFKTWTYPSDIYIAYILNKMKLKYWMQVPFLVQHFDFKSTLGNRSTKRQTRFFIDDVGEDYQ